MCPSILPYVPFFLLVFLESDVLLKCHIVLFEFDLVLWCFKRVGRVFEVSSVSQGSLKDTSRKFWGNFKGVKKVLRGFI